MGRPKQIFVAPGEVEDPLPIAESPWMAGRALSLPLEHWTFIREFANSLDPDADDRIWWGRTGSAFVTEIDSEPEELTRSIEFLESLAGALEVAEPLVAEPNATFPEAMTNDARAWMVRDVKAIAEEALRRGEPFEAWAE